MRSPGPRTAERYTGRGDDGLASAAELSEDVRRYLHAPGDRVSLGVSERLRGMADDASTASLSHRMRERRFERFEALAAQLPKPLSVIDIGGTCEFWEQRGWADRDDVSVTLVNLMEQERRHSNIHPTRGRRDQPRRARRRQLRHRLQQLGDRAPVQPREPARDGPRGPPGGARLLDPDAELLVPGGAALPVPGLALAAGEHARGRAPAPRRGMDGSLPRPRLRAQGGERGPADAQARAQAAVPGGRHRPRALRRRGQVVDLRRRVPAARRRPREPPGSTWSPWPTTAPPRCAAASSRSRRSSGPRSPWSTTRRPTTRWPRSPTCRCAPSGPAATAASPRAATSGSPRATRPYVLLLNPDARLERAGLEALVALLDAQPQAGLAAPRILEDGRRARLQPAPLPAPALDLRAGAVPAPALAARRLDRRADPRPRRLRAARLAGLGVRRLHADQARGARAAGRARRGLLPLLRGHRPLRAPARRRLDDPLRARGRGPPRGRGLGRPRGAVRRVRAQPRALRAQARAPADRCSRENGRSARTRHPRARRGCPAARAARAPARACERSCDRIGSG